MVSVDVKHHVYLLTAAHGLLGLPGRCARSSLHSLAPFPSLLGTGRMGVGGGGVWIGGKRERVYTYRYIVTTRMTCIKMGSDESHFNVSLIARDKVTRPCPQTTTFLKRKESRSGIEPRSFRLPAYRLTARPDRLSCPDPCFSQTPAMS